jgi:hypothetical protein
MSWRRHRRDADLDAGYSREDVEPGASSMCERILIVRFDVEQVRHAVVYMGKCRIIIVFNLYRLKRSKRISIVS